MKNVIIILVFAFVSTGAFAQQRSDFQGPKYKNYKAWEHKTVVKPVFTSTSNKAGLTGPEYKNFKPWKASANKSENEVIITSNHERNKLRGPAYKNYKPWKKKNK